SAPRPIAKAESDNCIVRQCSIPNPQRSSSVASPNGPHPSFDSGASEETSYMTPERSVCVIEFAAGSSTVELFLASSVGADSGGAFSTSTSSSFDSWITFRTLREQFEIANDP